MPHFIYRFLIIAPNYRNGLYCFQSLHLVMSNVNNDLIDSIPLFNQNTILILSNPTEPNEVELYQSSYEYIFNTISTLMNICYILKTLY